MVVDILTAEAKWSFETYAAIAGFIISLLSIYGFVIKPIKAKFKTKADQINVDNIEKELERIKKSIDEKIEDFKKNNMISHAEIKADITMVDQRNDKDHAILREDYRRGIDQLQKTIQDEFKNMIEILKKW